MDKPTVSVIIPAYNAEKYIAEAIESVLAQTYPEVECIVVDDGSTDRTGEIVRSYGSRVQYISQDNAERSTARNNGILHAKGDYISFLDADDYQAPEKIRDQVDLLEVHPEYDAVYSKVMYFRDNGSRSFYSIRRISPIGDIVKELILSNFITIHSPLFRKSAVNRIGGFDPAISRYEDWDFLLRLAFTGSRFAFIDKFHAFCRTHPENTVKDKVRMFDAKQKVAVKIVGQFSSELRAHGIDGRSVIAFHQADYGRILVLNGQVIEGRKLIRKACLYDFPHKLIFKLFALAASIFGYRVLVSVQRIVDSLRKYRS